MRARHVVLALILAAAATPSFAKPPVDYKDRDPDALVGVGPFQHLPALDETATIIVATRADPVGKATRFDPVLTNACRLGDFVSLPLNTLVVHFAVPKDGDSGQAALQIVPPDRRHLLVDQRHLAAPGETYYFEDAAYPSCRVWVGDLVRPRRLVGGTSLPAADPGALKKREAEIKGWPKQ